MNNTREVYSLFNVNDPGIAHVVEVYERILAVYETIRPLYQPYTQMSFQTGTTNHNLTYRGNNNSALDFQVESYG